jgi:hypothetical protein
MSISANSDFSLTVERIIKQALQKAGLLPLGQSPRSDQMTDARDMLNTKLAALHGKGVILGTTERTTLALTAGTSTYDLPSDTVDLTTDMAMVAKVGFNTQTPVYQISYDNYQRISDKTVTGIPTMVYVEKSGLVVRLLLWTVPTENSTLYFRRIRLFKNTDSGGVNPDVWIRQQELLVLYMAHDLAMGGNLPQNKVEYLGVLVTRAEKALLGDAGEKGDMQCYMDVR